MLFCNFALGFSSKSVPSHLQVNSYLTPEAKKGDAKNDERLGLITNKKT